jgi:uncharacterized RDD family membrane protein YckC
LVSLGGLGDAREMEVLRKYQTFWPRFWAGWIDGLIFLPLYYVDSWIQSATTETTLLVLWFILYTFSSDAYSVLMHARFGQTLGKMLTGVKVLDVSEAKLSFRQALLRDVVAIVFSLITVANALPRMLAGLDPFAEPSQFSWIDKFWMYGSVIWFAAELVTMLTNAKRRAVHDFIARSVVVRVRYFEAGAKRDAAAA